MFLNIFLLVEKGSVLVDICTTVRNKKGRREGEKVMNVPGRAVMQKLQGLKWIFYYIFLF